MFRVMTAISPLSGGSRVHAGGYATTRAAGREEARVERRERREALEAAPVLMELRTRVAALREEVLDATRHAARRVSPQVTGSSVLTRGPATRASLASTQEVNTVATSFSQRGPAWSGAVSSSAVTVGGTYTGSTSETYTFTAQNTRTVGGPQSIRLRMDDGAGVFVQNVEFAAGAPAGTTVTTSRGLTIALGAGLVRQNESFSLTASATAGTDIDPTKAFNGTRNASALLQPGTTVGNGSFALNGTTITVSASDTLDGVIARIDASGADVDASYDAATDTVRLERRTAGDLGIEMSGDTSGFLAAMKLYGATVTPGLAAGSERSMALLDSFDGVTSGTLTINGVAVAIDPASDSIEEVVQRIDDMGVDATLSEGGVVSLRMSGSRTFTLSDTSGLLDRLGISPGVVVGRDRARVSRRDADAVGRRVRQVANPLDRLLAETGSSSGVTAARALVQAAFARNLTDHGSGTYSRRGFSVSLGANGALSEVNSFTSSRADVSELTDDLRGDTDETLAFLVGADGDAGLLGEMIAAIDAALSELGGSAGLLVDRVA